MFISSISASVGALSRMRGRDSGRDPGSDTDRSMHEVDLTLQGHVWARQGREPNAEGGETKNTIKQQSVARRPEGIDCSALGSVTPDHITEREYCDIS